MARNLWFLKVERTLREECFGYYRGDVGLCGGITIITGCNSGFEDLLGIMLLGSIWIE
jgi:hypothetical protein